MAHLWVVNITLGTLLIYCQTSHIRYTLVGCWSVRCSWSSALSVLLQLIALASHLCTCVLHRQLCYLHTLKLPKFFNFHGDFHQKWHFAHPEFSFAHPELPFLAKSMLQLLLYSWLNTWLQRIGQRQVQDKRRNSSGKWCDSLNVRKLVAKWILPLD